MGRNLGGLEGFGGFRTRGGIWHGNQGFWGIGGDLGARREGVG